MNTTASDSKSKKEAKKKDYLLKKIDINTAKSLNQIRDKANKKNYGRKVRDSEIISIALKQINGDHIKELQEATYSERDRLSIAHESYQKTHGKISLDQFIGKLLNGEFSKQTN